MTTVRRGSKGNWVVYLQNSLRSMGYGVGPCYSDGNFGSGTESAVRRFQSDNGLSSDGIVGNGTWNKIKEHIRPIQQKLIEKGYSVGECGADGIYGYGTVEAVKNFQRQNGLNVDGIAGPNTKNVLFSQQSYASNEEFKNMINFIKGPGALGLLKAYYSKQAPRPEPRPEPLPVISFFNS